MAEPFWKSFEQGNAWDNFPEQELTPYAQRDLRNLSDSRAKAHLGGEFDEEQLADIDDRFAERERALRSRGMQDKQPEPSAASDIKRNIATINGRLFTKDPQTGMPVLLAEPAKDMRDKEEIELDRQAEREKRKFDYLSKLADKKTSEGRPVFSPEQLEEKERQLLGDEQTGQQVDATVQLMPPKLQESVQSFQAGTQAEFEATADIVGRVRKYWNRRAGRYELDPGDMVRAEAQLRAMENARRRYDKELEWSRRQEKLDAEFDTVDGVYGQWVTGPYGRQFNPLSTSQQANSQEKDAWVTKRAVEAWEESQGNPLAPDEWLTDDEPDIEKIKQQYADLYDSLYGSGEEVEPDNAPTPPPAASEPSPAPTPLPNERAQQATVQQPQPSGDEPKDVVDARRVLASPRYMGNWSPSTMNQAMPQEIKKAQAIIKEYEETGTSPLQKREEKQAEEFSKKWSTLKPGESLRGPDGQIYVKRG